MPERFDTEESPLLYEVARETSHRSGFPWTDPRTGMTYPPLPITVGCVIQIDPDYDDRFGACFAVVTALKSWGVQAYVRIPGNGDDGGDAYVRVPFEKCVRIGAAEWVQERHLGKAKELT